MSTWGVYSIQGRLPGGTHTTAGDRRAKAWFVRWRVDGTARRRTFRQKGHAKAFQDKLNNARLNSWSADERGWPIDAASPAPVVEPASTAQVGHTFESYVWEVWWPVVGPTFGDKNPSVTRRLPLDSEAQRQVGTESDTPFTVRRVPLHVELLPCR